MVKRVTPAVVNVYAARVIENRNPFMNDPLFRRFFGTVPREQVMRSLGSGVIVDPSGLVVTNYHVIEGASEVKVALSDKREFDAEIVLKDEHSDLTILRLKGANEKFPVLDFANSDDLQVGDVVLAIGDPFGVGQTVTHGIVSALARTQVGISDYQFFIQTDAAINPGNSGGALVDLNGRLVGINTAIYSRSGGSQGIGFAIPANMVRVVVASAKGGSAAVKRPWLGAKLQEVTAEIADSLGLKRPSGALVANVAAGGPAARAGIKTGDVIAAIDGTVVDDPNSFDYRFATKPLGGSAQVTLLRQGREMTVAVGLQTAPESPRDEVGDPGPLAIYRRQGREPVAGAGRRAAARHGGPGRRHHRRCRRLDGADHRLPQGRHRAFGQQSENRKIGRPRSRHPRRRPAVARHHQSRRPGNIGHVQRMSANAILPVMAGDSRSKNGVASLAYARHDGVNGTALPTPSGCPALRPGVTMPIYWCDDFAPKIENADAVRRRRARTRRAAPACR